jgi:hypothetical protein
MHQHGILPLFLKFNFRCVPNIKKTQKHFAPAVTLYCVCFVWLKMKTMIALMCILQSMQRLIVVKEEKNGKNWEIRPAFWKQLMKQKFWSWEIYVVHSFKPWKTKIMLNNWMNKWSSILNKVILSKDSSKTYLSF